MATNYKQQLSELFREATIDETSRVSINDYNSIRVITQDGLEIIVCKSINDNDLFAWAQSTIYVNSDDVRTIYDEILIENTAERIKTLENELEILKNCGK